MLSWLKLTHHRHSGQLRPHEHTSYIPLGILLLFVGLALMAYTSYAASPPPESSSVGLTGTMPGKPPTIAAVIKVPNNQTRFTSSPVATSGTCPANTLVEMFKNDIFAGSTPCTDNGVFSLDIDLLVGTNTIIARVYDALNQPGPDSNAVVIYYDALPVQAGPLTSLDFSKQLILNTDAAFRGVFPEQELSIPIDIIGGVPPYAVNIQWGDSNNKVVSRDNNNSFKISHVYQRAGTYQISIQASDTEGRVAFLTVASIVNGQPSVTASNTIPTETANQLLVLWPLYASAVAVVISFFIGEYREKRILIRHGQLLT